MKIRFTKKRLRANLFPGLIWLALGVAVWIFYDYQRWTDFFYIGMALLYLGQYIFEKQNHYLTITGDEIKVNRPFGKRINTSDIDRIKKFDDEYRLISGQRELKINTQIIEPDSLKKLDVLLAKLNLPPEKTPFANNAYNTSLS